MKFWQSGYNPHIRLTQQELLEISQRISHEFSPNASSAFPELVLLPVDPLHIYAYWNLGENNINSRSHDYANYQLILRIYYQSGQDSGVYNTKQWFDVAVNRSKHRQKVPVPNDHTCYSAVIGKQYIDDSFAAYAYSNIIHVPRSGSILENESTQSNQHETRDKTFLTEATDTVSNNFIMKDNLYVDSMDAPMNSQKKPTITSHPANLNNNSGVGIND